MLFTIAVAVEMIYFIRNLNLVLPHCFIINLLQSFVSGSKKVSTLNGKVTLGAGYTTYKTWLVSFGSIKIQCPAEDVVTYFDNIGKYIIKKYRVTSQKTKKADITAPLHLSLGGNKLQTNAILKPSNCCNKKSSDEKEEAMLRIINESNNDFRQYRINYIAIILKIAMFENNDVKRKIEVLKRSERSCSNKSCKKLFTKFRKKCDACGGKVIKEEHIEPRLAVPKDWAPEKIFNIGQEVNKNAKLIQIGEPVMVNPNSFINAEYIFDQYKKLHGISEAREWVALGCDGPPYRMVSKLIEANPEKYDWFCLVPGLGHLHMNQLKTLFKVLDYIMLEPLRKEALHFSLPKAYQYFVETKVSHKAYQALQYVQWCYEEKCTITPEGFLEWFSAIENETFGLIG